MRHGKQRTRFGRQPRHRAATLNMLATSLILHQRIKTTHVKAKEAKRVVEKLITIAKTDSVAARRKAYAVLNNNTIVSTLFKDVAPLFKDRAGGYTRIIPYDFRKGDGASMVFLELTEKKVEEKKLPKKAKKEEKAVKPAVKPKAVKPKAAKPAPPKEEKVEQPHTAPEIPQKVKEEKTVEEVKKEKAKDETKKADDQKGFIKKMTGFFRRRQKM